MKKGALYEAIEAVLEELSAIEHERWSHWQKYMHSTGIFQPDGSLLLPAKLVSQWQRQINTPYESLTDEEKESDREQVRKYLPTIVNALSENN